MLEDGDLERISDLGGHLDRAWVSFMWRYPNLIPLDEPTVLEIARRVGRFTFEHIYGGWWGRVVVRDGADVVRRSADPLRRTAAG